MQNLVVSLLENSELKRSTHFAPIIYLVALAFVAAPIAAVTMSNPIVNYSYLGLALSAFGYALVFHEIKRQKQPDRLYSEGWSLLHVLIVGIFVGSV